MMLIKDTVRDNLSSVFSGLSNPVELVMFTQDIECQSCAQVHSFLEELAGLGDRVSLHVHDFVGESHVAGEYGVDKIPAIIVRGEEDYGIRFYGIPGGYELASFIETIVAVSQRESGLDPEVLKILGKLSQPVHIQVMVNSTCPRCPDAALLAHKFALASKCISSDIIQIKEFPQINTRYEIDSVPTTIINEKRNVSGVLPAIELAREVFRSTSDRRSIWPRGMWQ